jgi:hypothetical protein
MSENVGMTLADFKLSTGNKTPPADLPPTLLALWHDARGDWTAAHETAQNIDGKDGAWIHAYLHRKEGDLGNASYWYRRAGKPDARDPLQAEWERIASSLLE